MGQSKTKTVWEFGDFQTPPVLAEKVCEIVANHLPEPRTILEPCCGVGGFVMAAAARFPKAERITGLDINPDYLQTLNAAIQPQDSGRISTIQGSFFEQSWPNILAGLPSPLLIIGNPPWVTSADLGRLQSKNLPQKSNFQKLSGFDARTGKSNFDISEWILLQHLDWMQTRTGAVAMLVKTAVARKVLTYAWTNGLLIGGSSIYQINALKHFGAAVDACLLLIQFDGVSRSKDCDVYESLEAATPSHVIGHHDGILVNDAPTYQRTKHLKGTDPFYTWRSGIKHDCSKVMELEKDGDKFINGLGETVTIEETYLYPLYKSSDVGNRSLRQYRKHVLVTQKIVGDETSHIMHDAPETWDYLTLHQEKLDGRGSSVYKGRPKFSIFGVGDYTFAPWKVAISGLYKSLHFKVIAPIEEKPALVDDTINFLPCQSKEEADFVAALLNSEPAKEFYSSIIFWNEKRPITINLLKKLDIGALASLSGLEDQYKKFASQRIKKKGHFQVQ